jgi:hypothetical protein
MIDNFSPTDESSLKVRGDPPITACAVAQDSDQRPSQRRRESAGGPSQDALAAQAPLPGSIRPNPVRPEPPRSKQAFPRSMASHPGETSGALRRTVGVETSTAF